MMVAELRQYDEVWSVDFEFIQPDGERIERVVCMAAEELFTGRVVRVWEGEFGNEPPFRTDARTLAVAFYASAEMQCFDALGWEFPANILDLFAEHIWLKNNLPLPDQYKRKTLLSCMQLFGLGHMAPAEKTNMRDLILSGGPWSSRDRKSILKYCHEDVTSLVKLLPLMVPMLELKFSLFRGEYMKAVARMRRRGVPIDGPTFRLIREHRDTVRRQLIEGSLSRYPVFDSAGSFKQHMFIEWLDKKDLLATWPRADSGLPSTASAAMQSMSRARPRLLNDLRELLASDRVLKANRLAVGNDDRNRCMLSPFGSRTGRNQPSNSEFIFGPACWMRGLIQPARGRAVAYVDWAQQEIGIAAALSGDEALAKAYATGDPYLSFAKMAQAVPASATRDSHADARELFKQCMLAVNYGMAEFSLALRINGTVAHARHLLLLHQGIYHRYWAWSNDVVNQCLYHGYTDTELGWRMFRGNDPNLRAIANFPCQGNGAETMRVAAILMYERDIPMCCPVHDAFLVEGPATEIDDIVLATQQAMSDASAIVLDGFRLASEAKVIRHPDRYMDKRGVNMWGKVLTNLAKLVEPVEGRRLLSLA